MDNLSSELDNSLDMNNSIVSYKGRNTIVNIRD